MYAFYGILRQPRFPGVTIPSGGYWRGTSADAGRVAFFRDGTATVSDRTCHGIQYWLSHGDSVTAGTLSPAFMDCDGYGYWTNSNNTFTLAHTPTYGWAFSNMPPHVQPREYDTTTAVRQYDSSAGLYYWEFSAISAGDAFFTGDLPEVGGGSATWIPRGSERNAELSASLTLSAFWPRLERSASAGDGLAGFYGDGFDGWEGASAIVGFPPPSGASGEEAGRYFIGDTIGTLTTGDIAQCH